MVSLIAGAGGMYCGSCLRDNRLAARLIQQGRDVHLLPLYTPIRTDETDVSHRRVLYGGINVYLRQRLARFPRLPGFLDRFLDSPGLLRTVGRLAARTRAEELGPLTVSVLEGAHGAQRREVEKVLEVLDALKPSLVHLPMLLLAGLAEPIRSNLRVPVLSSLSGEDIFLDALPEPFRHRCDELITTQARHIDAFLAPTEYYGRYAADRFRLDADRVHYAPLGIRAADFGPRQAEPQGPFTLGYLARICREKGVEVLGHAFIELRRRGRDCRLRIAGYLGGADRPVWRDLRRRFQITGVAPFVDFVGEVDLAGKINFLHSLHVLSVPAVYAEAKGLYLLEAMAAGVPVVQPRHGSFTELVADTGGGVLFEPGNATALADALSVLMDDHEVRRRLGVAGSNSVHARYHDEVMATRTWAIYEQYVSRTEAVEVRS